MLHSHCSAVEKRLPHHRNVGVGMGALSTHTHMCVCPHFPHHHLHHYLDMQHTHTPFVHGLIVDGGKRTLPLGVDDSTHAQNTFWASAGILASSSGPGMVDDQFREDIHMHSLCVSVHDFDGGAPLCPCPSLTAPCTTLVAPKSNQTGARAME